MKNKNALLILATTILVLVSCSDDNDSSSDSCPTNPVPSVDEFVCSTNATHCTNNTADDNSGKVTVFIMKTTVTCGIAGTPTEYYGYAEGSLSPGDCDGMGDCTVSGLPGSNVWKASDGSGMNTNVCSGAYQYCAKIDTNANGVFDSGEPYRSVEIQVDGTSSTGHLTGTWSDIP